MFKIITDIKEYVTDIDVTEYEFDPSNYDLHKNIFGKKVGLINDEWSWHVHLKVTDICQAKCEFCIEEGCIGKEDAKKYIERVDGVLSEMSKSGILNTVSITGGEPLLFSEFFNLVDIIKKHDVKFLTMNTNAEYLVCNIDFVDRNFDSVNISRHHINDVENRNIFKSNVPSVNELKNIKRLLTNCKMRLQCIITESMSFNDLIKFTSEFSFVDDFSFRKLMVSSKNDYSTKLSDSSYKGILDRVASEGKLIEQIVRDYYVYEIWKINNTTITFSYADMDLLLSSEKNEGLEVCREFILHPDGTFGGSWDKKNKNILPSFC